MNKNSVVLFHLRNSNSGQALIEYLLLLITVVAFSYLLLKGINGPLTNFWIGILNKVNHPIPVSLQ